MNDSVHYDVLLRSLKALRSAGTHGARSLSAMRTAGHEALEVLIERDLMRMMAEQGARKMPMEDAIRKAQEVVDGEKEEA